MRTREYRFYKRTGGCVWKNGEYLIEGQLDEDGITIFRYWRSVDAEVIGTTETLDEAIDDCSEHKKGQKIMRFAAEPENNPFAAKEQNP